ncbi:hypothetical protein AAG906_013744 [Vitis piasezkii]
MSIVGPSQSRYTQSRQTTSRRTVEASFLGSTKFSSDSYSRRSKEEPSLAHQTKPDEGTNSTRTSRKRSNTSPTRTPSTRRGGATAYVKDPKGTSRLVNPNNHIRMALSTTKATVDGSANNASPTRLY